MSKPVKLKVHRNTVARKQATAVRQDLTAAAKRLSKFPGLAGYAIVVWDDGWRTDCQWDTGGNIPGSVMPDYVRSALQRVMTRMDVEAALADTPEDDGA